MERVVEQVIDWYEANKRPLPWRAPGTSAYAILVSEVMAQQTPVERVVPAWQAWLELWPTPADLAAATPADVLRMWGRLGYPRRALRLREAAIACVERHDGQIPASYDELIALPGIGDYTAAAVLAFAYGQRAVVLDTNVRRVLARARFGQARCGVSIAKAERAEAEALLPSEDAPAAVWAQAVMELGARICTASKPLCEACPIQRSCAWITKGKPEADIPRQRSQKFAGTDRQVRGLLMAVLREHDVVSKKQLDVVWSDSAQRERALDSLLDDGLVEMIGKRFRLPQA